MKDNTRFLPYLALMPPLRHIFIHQSTPCALVSPCLRLNLDMQVWRDTMVSSYLPNSTSHAPLGGGGYLDGLVVK